LARAFRHVSRLTDRDVDLLVELANDRTIKDAAEAIGCSESRAYGLVQHIKVELDCVTLHAAILRAHLTGHIFRDGDGVRDTWRATA
jgi:DNA-binding CsgD family transcriptional regulator